MENMARSLFETLTNDIEIQTAETGLLMDIQFQILSEKQLQLMQFKAKQKLLHMKEENRWNEFCELQGFTKALEEPRDYNQNYSDVLESSSKTCLPSYKSIGIQVKQRQQFSAKVFSKKLQVPEDNSHKGKADQSNSDSKNVHPEEAEGVILPQALDGIKKQLEDIQQNLSEFSKNMKPQEQKEHFSLSNPKTSYHDKEIATAESSVENRRKILQKSLVTSFQRLQKSAKQKKFLSSPKAKKKDEKNIGFILPSVLKEQRASARRSYLSSLPVLNSVHETRRKVLRNGNKRTEKSLHQQESKPVPSKPIFTRDRMEENGLFQQELLTENRNLALSDIKNSSFIEEKNVDIIVDEILDDLLAETVLDLHKAEKIKKNKITEQLGYMCQKLNDIESEETAIRQKWSTVTFQNMQTNFSSESIHHPAILPTIIIKSSKPPAQKPNNGNFHLTENIREKWVQLKDEVQDRNLQTANFNGSSGIIMSKQEQNIFQENFHLLDGLKPNTDAQASTSKTVTMQCDPNASLDNVYQLSELGVGPEVLTNIYNYKKRFHQYLHRTSLAQKGKFNPLNITERIAVSLLEDCLQDIAEELIEIPTALITDLYNQEFLQSSQM